MGFNSGFKRLMNLRRTTSRRTIQLGNYLFDAVIVYENIQEIK
jgi:hypothetical protein